VNEDQLYDAAEREMNLYRDEITRLQAELENQVARGDRLEGKNEDIAADRDQLRERVARTAAKLDADALATAPSKKSEIQAETAARLRETLGDGA
jgi:ABC-type transporter Mla subunit MlaD